MSVELVPEPLTAKAFAPFGDILEPRGDPAKIINQGMCARFHDLAQLDFGTGRAGISLFDAKARTLPYLLDMMERHPEGSQAFVPVSGVPMLVSVALDNNGAPAVPRVFITSPQQSINIHRNVWHGVLAPLDAPGKYIVIDRIGEGLNLEEHWFQTPFVVNPMPKKTPAKKEAGT